MDEEIIIPLILFSFILSLVWMILGYAKWKYQQRQQQPAGNSLRMSELQALMREAVAEANAPLLDRIERLEEEILAGAAPDPLPAQDRRADTSFGEAEKEAAQAGRRRVT